MLQQWIGGLLLVIAGVAVVLLPARLAGTGRTWVRPATRPRPDGLLLRLAVAVAGSILIVTGAVVATGHA